MLINHFLVLICTKNPSSKHITINVYKLFQASFYTRQTNIFINLNVLKHFKLIIYILAVQLLKKKNIFKKNYFY